MIPDWLPWLNFALNVLVIPVLTLIWNIKVELVKLNGRIGDLERRVDAVDRRHEHMDFRGVERRME